MVICIIKKAAWKGSLNRKKEWKVIGEFEFQLKYRHDKLVEWEHFPICRIDLFFAFSETKHFVLWKKLRTKESNLHLHRVVFAIPFDLFYSFASADRCTAAIDFNYFHLRYFYRFPWARNQMMNVLSPVKRTHEIYDSNFFMIMKFGNGEGFKQRIEYHLKCCFRRDHKKRCKYNVLRKTFRSVRWRFFSHVQTSYSHFISRMTLVDKGGNMCPLLAWHV